MDNTITIRKVRNGFVVKIEADSLFRDHNMQAGEHIFNDASELYDFLGGLLGLRKGLSS